MKTTKQKTKQTEEQQQKISYHEGVGRRREATARVRLYVINDAPISLLGQTVARGDIIVNGKPISEYFPGDVMKKLYTEPFRTTNTIGRFGITVKVSGGGLMGQLGAFILGVSRALEKVDKEKFRPILKKRGFMKRDPRAKQRRKAGYAGKARARKQSPKR
ncbi:MAG: 30S ribosomal protein S9 [Patescibacteria group bacterium]|nr:30S ribosomal protein S9 [Patescibacteria group bacterium]